MKYVIELGKCIAVRGTVVRTSNVKPLVTRMAFKCASCSGTQVCSCIAMCSIKLLYIRIIYILYAYACVVYTYTYVHICDRAWENRSYLHVKFDLILRV